MQVDQGIIQISRAYSKMSTLRDDLKQNSPLDSHPPVGLHLPSPHPQPLTSEEQNNLGERETQVERPSTESPLVSEEETSPESPLASEEESSSEEEYVEEEGWKVAWRHSICGNSWRDAKAILDQNPNALTAETTNDGYTALHWAPLFGHVGIVKDLLSLLPPQSILIPDHLGNTALVMACWFSGSTQVAKCLVNKNKDILVTTDNRGRLPVQVAFRNGH